MLKRKNRLSNKGDFSFVYFEKEKDNFLKKRLFTANFKIEKFLKKDISPTCVKLRLIISSKKVKLSVNRNKIKRMIKYFFIKNNKLESFNNQEFLFINLINKLDKIPKYKDLEKELESVL